MSEAPPTATLAILGTHSTARTPPAVLKIVLLTEPTMLALMALLPVVAQSSLS